MAASAQLSLAKTQLLPRRPIHSGRNPCGSRMAISLRGLISTMLYAPSMRSMTLSIACSTLGVRVRAMAMRCSITSVSLVD